MSENLPTLFIEKPLTANNYFCIYIHKAVLAKALFNTSEHNLSKWSYYLFELTSVIKVKLFITSAIMATKQDVQKKTGTKFKTLKLLEKNTLRIYERNREWIN